jgi:hypothetical protein
MKSRLVIPVLLSFPIFSAMGGQSAPLSGAWASMAQMIAGRAGACAAQLADGSILITGGIGSAGPLDSAEILAGGSFSAAAPMAAARSSHTCVALKDGRVLVTGGVDSAGETARAEIYDPAGNRWAPAADMAFPRSGHTATLLRDGRVLIAGGQGPGAVYNTLELYDPSANTFALLSTGQLSSPRKEHVAVLLANGRVLLAGGSDGSNALAWTDVFDPSTATVSPGPGMAAARAGASATTLLDGRVLIAGGSSGTEALATAEIYDPATNTFSETGGMAAPRSGHLAFRLPDNNQVLLVGGDAAGRSAELFAPWRGAFQPTGALDQVRALAAGAPSGVEGRLVLAGGRSSSGRGAAILNSSTEYRFATLRTDSGSYAPGSLAKISGSGWQPGEKVTLTVRERSVAQAETTLALTADAAGDVETQYQMPQSRDKTYDFLATGAAAQAVAQASTGAAFNLNQCADGTGYTNPLAEATATCSWVNGNVNGAKASYFEGDSLPYQTVITGLTPGAKYVLTIQWNTSSSNKHTLDFLTGYQRTVGNADPFSAVFQSGCTPTSAAIPDQPDLAGTTAGTDQHNILGTNSVNGLSNGSFYMCGGTLGTLGPYSPIAGSNATYEQLAVPFTANGSTAVLAWAAHISTHLDWGAGNSAVSLSGSPFHTSLVQYTFNGTAVNIGSQDRSLALSAVIFPASIAINKTISNGPSNTFNFTLGANPADNVNFTPAIDTTSPAPYNFTLSGGTSRSFGIVYPGLIYPVSGSTFAAYTFTESVPSGWQTPSISCTTSGGLTAPGPIGNGTSPSVTFTPQEGDQIVCNYTNTANSDTVTLNKNVTPSTDNGSFNLSITPGGGSSCSNTVGGAGGSASCSEVYNAAVTVSETAGNTSTNLANYTSTLACSNNVTINPSPATTSASFTMPTTAVTCTLNNTRKQHNVTLTKVLSPGTDTGTFNLTIADTTNGASKTTASPVGNNGSLSYTIYGGASVNVSEAAAGTTNLSNYTYHLLCNTGPNTSSIIDVTTSSGSFSMPDTDVSCTLTNTRIGHTVTLTKATVPTNDKGTFNLSIAASGIVAITGPSGSGSVTNSGGNGTIVSGTVTGGISVTVSETGTNLGNYTYHLTCNNATPGVDVTTSSATFTMPDTNVSCTLTNTRNQYNVTLAKTLLPATDTGKFNLTIADTTNSSTSTTPNPVGNNGSVTLAVYGGATVQVSEAGASGTDLGNYNPQLSCGNGGQLLNVAASSGTFTMPDAAVSCTLTNTRKQYNVTLTKALVPSTDPGTFNLTITDTTNNSTATTPSPVGNNGSISLQIYGGASVQVSEAAATGTNLGNYTYQLQCGTGGAQLNVTTASGTFTMPDYAVSCTLTNSALPATLTIYKICAPVGATAPAGAFLVSIALNGATTSTSTPTVACGGNSGKISLNPGTYIVSEPTASYPAGWHTQAMGLLNGWTAPGTFGGDCDASGNVALSYGQDKSCYVLNVSDVCTPALPGVSNVSSLAADPVSPSSLAPSAVHPRTAAPMRPGAAPARPTPGSAQRSVRR